MTSSRHNFPTAPDLATELAKIDAWSAKCAAASNARDRAWKVVNRLMPPLESVPHGFHQKDSFFDALYYQSERKELFYAIKARIEDKNAARVTQ